MITRHVVVDRDGVLNVEPRSGWISDPGDWRWERGAEAGLAKLARPDVVLSIATNQSGVGRGVLAIEDLVRLHTWLRADLVARGLRVAGIYACIHAPHDGCRCRKPAPGLVLDAMVAAGVPADDTVLIGDAARDLDAAAAAGIAAILVRTGKGTTVTTPVEAYADLDGAVTALTARWSRRR